MTTGKYVATESIEMVSAEDASPDSVFMDVRSPKEFDEAHVKGATNLPILDNLERHEVGILYKQAGREKAFKKGEEFFTPKISSFLSAVREMSKKGSIVVYCWRGGYRSRTVAELLVRHGIPARQMIGGFKGYMALIHNKINELGEIMKQKKCYALAGQTGTNKTEILRRLAGDFPVLDLEGLAQHRSSVFGSIGLKPRTQKQFLIELFHELQRLKDALFFLIEHESSRIGHICVPKEIMSCISNADIILLKRSIDSRISSIMDEYFVDENETKRMYGMVERIQNHIGKRHVKTLHMFLDEEKYEEFTRFLLERYYDLKYALPKKGPLCVIEEDCADAVEGRIRDLAKEFC